jgi:transposase
MAVRQGKLRDGVRQVDAAGRRWYTKAFKAQVVAACRAPGTSVARVSLEHGLNANLVRKWLRRAEGALEGHARDAMRFVPVIAVASDVAMPEGTGAAVAEGAAIDADAVVVVELGAARIRIGAAASPALVHAIVRALR